MLQKIAVAQLSEEGAATSIGSFAKDAARDGRADAGPQISSQQPLLPETAAPRPATFKLADPKFLFGTEATFVISPRNSHPQTSISHIH